MTGDPLNLFLLGATYGMTVCTLSCLPYLGPFIMGTGDGFRDGCYSVFTFFLGKTVVYALLGGLAAHIGRSLPASPNTRAFMAAIIFCAALAIPIISSAKCSKTMRNSGKLISLFTMGGISGLAPCPPLVAVLLLAAGQKTVLAGVACGLAFGAGLSVSPALPLGGMLSCVSGGIKKQYSFCIPFMKYVSMSVMILTGVRMIFT